MTSQLLAVTFLAASLSAPAAAAPPSGVYGTVTRGPTRPVCVVGRPCTAPAAHIRLLFASGGRSVGTTTDREGRYRLALRPASYEVRLATSPRVGGLRPVSVVVRKGRYVRLDLSIDTGIR